MNTSSISLKVLLLVDGISAYFSAMITLLFASSLAEVLQVPTALLQGFSLVTTVYGSAAFIISNRAFQRWAPRIFIYANYAWVLGCIVLSVALFPSSSLLGVSFFISQAIFVILLTRMQSRHVFRLRV